MVSKQTKLENPNGTPYPRPPFNGNVMFSPFFWIPFLIFNVTLYLSGCDIPQIPWKSNTTFRYDSFRMLNKGWVISLLFPSWHIAFRRCGEQRGWGRRKGAKMSLLSEPGFGWVIGLVKGCTLFFQANTNHPVLHLVNYDIGFGNDTQSFARNTSQVHIVKG